VDPLDPEPDYPELDPGPPGRAHLVAALVLVLLAMFGLAFLIAALMRAL